MKEVWTCSKCGTENEADALKLHEPGQRPSQVPQTPLYAVATLGAVAAAPLDHTVKLVMLVIISLAVLGSSLYILLSPKYTGPRVQWAVSGLTAVISFWFGKFS